MLTTVVSQDARENMSIVGERRPLRKFAVEIHGWRSKLQKFWTASQRVKLKNPPHRSGSFRSQPFKITHVVRIYEKTSDSSKPQKNSNLHCLVTLLKNSLMFCLLSFQNPSGNEPHHRQPELGLAFQMIGMK